MKSELSLTFTHSSGIRINYQASVGGMGFVHVKIRIGNLTSHRVSTIETLVDSGAYFSMIPSPVLRGLGIRPLKRQRFQLANGKTVRYRVGEAWVSIGRDRAPTPVIFGPARSQPLLGVLTLEALCLMVDPVRKRLRKSRLLLV